ncbi:hypothetical protein F5Y10DRAFT_271635 [Nemania abortiva]|nr:hypothetical protein F5Y10DRAFT_271635 [Nemania abortiva]
MTSTVTYTIIFGSLASAIALAGMVQNYLQRQRSARGHDIEAQIPEHSNEAYELNDAAVMPPGRAILQSYIFLHGMLYTPHGQ